uniref:Uncharacterized protein n=1 Tax=Arundo donax TaxID=35708 RepID=A0A0A9GPQ0_ARUDO
MLPIPPTLKEPQNSSSMLAITHCNHFQIEVHDYKFITNYVLTMHEDLPR